MWFGDQCNPSIYGVHQHSRIHISKEKNGVEDMLKTADVVS